MKQLKIKCDVLVLGAGPAGCSAALAAARNGAHVLMAETKKEIGGIVEAASLTGFCGFFKNDLSFPELLNPFGISMEITGHLCSIGYAPFKYGRVWLQPVPKLFMKGFFLPRLERTSSIELYLGITIHDISLTDNKIVQVKLKTPEGQLEIEPRKVIDCSGTGISDEIFARMFYIEEKSPHTQASVLTFILKNCEELDSLKRLEALYRIKKAIQSGDLSNSWFVTDFQNGFDGDIIGRVNLQYDVNTKKIEEIISTEIHNLIKHVQKINGFDKAELVEFKEGLSKRIGFRIKGKYELTEADLFNGAVFEDSHIQAAWPIEEWDFLKGQTLKYLNSVYSIPDRALISSGCSNLFAGGGTVSSDRKAHSSLRVCGTAFATGERSGTLTSE